MKMPNFIEILREIRHDEPEYKTQVYSLIGFKMPENDKLEAITNRD